jgi:putative addiction module antidote
MLTFKVTTVGSSLGFILDKEARIKLGVEKGDVLYVTDAPDGGMRISPYHPDFQRQMALAEGIMHDDREILRALAK